MILLIYSYCGNNMLNYTVGLFQLLKKHTLQLIVSILYHYFAILLSTLHILANVFPVY